MQVYVSCWRRSKVLFDSMSDRFYRKKKLFLSWINFFVLRINFHQKRKRFVQNVWILEIPEQWRKYPKLISFICVISSSHLTFFRRFLSILLIRQTKRKSVNNDELQNWVTDFISILIDTEWLGLGKARNKRNLRPSVCRENLKNW